jgi:phosphatidate cytidylyltransferase
VKGDMATPVTEMGIGATQTRVLSAAVALLPTLAAIHYGSPFFGAFVLLGCLILGWEWSRMCGLQPAEFPILLIYAALGAAVVAAIVGHLELSLVLIVGGAIVTSLAAFMVHKSADGSTVNGIETALGKKWVGSGLLYFGVPAILLIWLRDVCGRETVYWLFALVWATDTGAFVSGKMIGGPKLAPAISPKKTWAGLVGGMFCAGLVGAAFSHFSGHETVLPLVALSAGLALSAQGGDLFESWVKRRIGVKDAGSIMPGHGGLLDRVDGLLIVAILVAAIAYIGGKNGLVWL